MRKQQAPRGQASIKDFFNTGASKTAQVANAINRSRPKSFFHSRIKDRLAENISSNELVDKPNQGGADEAPNSQSDNPHNENVYERHEELIIHDSPLAEAPNNGVEGNLQVIPSAAANISMNSEAEDQEDECSQTEVVNNLKEELKKANERLDTAKADVTKLKSEIMTAQRANNSITTEFIRVKEKYKSLKDILKKKNVKIAVHNEAAIQLIGPEKKNDLTFITKAILLSYKGEEYLLPDLYAIRRQSNNAENQVVVEPETKLQIRNLFSRRLRRTKVIDSEYDARMKKFDSLLSKALFKIRKGIYN